MNPDPTLSIAQYVWKTRQMMLCAGIIAAAAVRSPAKFWPDECDFSAIAKDDRNCIGNTYKALIGLKLIRKTGDFRGSKDKQTGRKGSPVFAYTVTAVNVMRELLRRLEPELERELNPQKLLALAA